MSILRPLLPLLMLIPLIALTGAARAEAPATPQPVARRIEMIRIAAPAVARIFTVSAQSCVRTGNRMVC